MSSALCWAGAQARLAPCPRQQIATRQHSSRRLAQRAPRQRPPAGGSSTRRPLPPAAAATWQPPPGLAILPWTGDPEQVEALEALRARMAASPYPEAAEDEATLRWFLQDRKLDVAEAEEKLLKMLRWRREFGCAPPGTAAGSAGGGFACTAVGAGHTLWRYSGCWERTGRSAHNPLARWSSFLLLSAGVVRYRSHARCSAYLVAESPASCAHRPAWQQAASPPASPA